MVVVVWKKKTICCYLAKSQNKLPFDGHAHFPLSCSVPSLDSYFLFCSQSSFVVVDNHIWNEAGI